MAVSLISLGRLDEAEASLSQLPTLEHLAPMTSGPLALLRLAQGRDEEALTAARKAVEGARADNWYLQDAALLAEYVHAAALDANGQHDAAVAALRRGLTSLDKLASHIEDPDERRALYDHPLGPRQLVALADDWGLRR